MVKKKNIGKKRENWSAILTVGALIAVIMLMFTTLQLAQDVRQNDVLGSPGWTLPILAVVMSVAALFIDSKNKSMETVNSILLTVVACCMLFWLFGLTGAGRGLVSSNNSLYEQEGVCPGLAGHPDCYEE